MTVARKKNNDVQPAITSPVLNGSGTEQISIVSPAQVSPGMLFLDQLFRDQKFAAYDIGGGIIVQLVTITPTIAAACLQRLGGSQRSLNKKNLFKIKADIKAGRWRLNGEPIIFNNEGDLSDGRHRLQAVVEVGLAIETVVTRGIQPEGYDSIDSGLSRQVKDALKAAGYPNPQVLGPAVMLFLRYGTKTLRRQSVGGYNQSGYTSTTVVAEVDKRLKLSDCTNKSMTVGKLLHCPAAAAFCYYMFSERNASDTEFFFEGLETGADLPASSPILILRNYLLNGKVEKKKKDNSKGKKNNKNEDKNTFDGDDVTMLFFRAWNAYRQKNPLLKKDLKIFEDDILPKPV